MNDQRFLVTISEDVPTGMINAIVDHENSRSYKLIRIGKELQGNQIDEAILQASKVMMEFIKGE